MFFTAPYSIFLMPRKKPDDCTVEMTVCLTEKTNDIVETYQAFVKKQKQKTSYSKNQTINRIITEWGEDRHLTLEVTKKQIA